MSHVEHAGRVTYLADQFTDEVLAARAYDETARKLRGAEAIQHHLNFPSMSERRQRVSRILDSQLTHAHVVQVHVPRTKVDFDTAVEPAAAVSSVVNAIVDAVCSDAATYTAEQQLRTGIHRKTSRYRGVSRRSASSWVIPVRQKGRTRYLGEFVSEEDAARAYDDFRRKNTACLHMVARWPLGAAARYRGSTSRPTKRNGILLLGTVWVGRYCRSTIHLI
jgi:hypothetical protein